jgi:DnaK suppressor protein
LWYKFAQNFLSFLGGKITLNDEHQRYILCERSNEAMARKITKSQLATLQQEREHALAELNHLREDLKAEFELEDIDDAAPDLVERDKIQALIFSFGRKIESIDHAIQQAQEIGYGICEKCGKDIEPERLEIFPETTLCIQCKRESERLTRRISFNLRQSW